MADTGPPEGIRIPPWLPISSFLIAVVTLFSLWWLLAIDHEPTIDCTVYKTSALIIKPDGVRVLCMPLPPEDADAKGKKTQKEIR